ncbi:SPOR domain-containing protein [Xanthomonas translucens]|uniref:SPOR domain-containing protein n=1 Tax=Xanthomonas campestris pv. translucens TaxID=343 RepID=UPI001F61347C|nr:SPOR domain-containing protein [Xanthomonas translucens]UNU10864.1 SPOR domain-containing protein [Xanthomonas translucens pv. translucens]
MLFRALLVVLTILNLGVALWWATQPQTPAPAPLPALPAGVATLQLVPASVAAPPAAFAAPPPTAHAAPAPAADVPAASALAADAPAATAVPAIAAPAPAAAAPQPPKAPSVAVAAAAAPVCLSLGPYSDRAAAETAAAALGTAAPRPRLREVGDDAATSFRVLLPTIGGEDGVKAAVDRIVAAGIRDYYPIREGDAGNAIALGQYRSREGAERRKAELAHAGFNVDLIPSGGSGQSRWWLDLRTDSAAQATALRRQLGAQRQRALDCATLR